MARAVHRLTAVAVARHKKPGMYPDGGGLWLQITKSASKSWSFRFMLNRQAREMGLGPLHTIGLADARAAAVECRKLLLAKIDPIDARKAKQAGEALNAARSITFDECAAEYIEAQRPGWSNPKHVDQWTNTLNAYASPVFGNLPVQLVDVDVIYRALTKKNLWTEKTETATRVRQRIEAVLDWATVSGFRKGDNPARWAGHLEHKLTAPSKIKNVKHISALPFGKIASFLLDLKKQEGVAARALEFMILTAARTGEIRGAVWSEIDLEEKAWTIPAERMKMKREHRVPLCDRAVAILEEMQKLKADDQPYVFPGGKAGQAMSENALIALLKRMDPDGKKWVDGKTRKRIAPHGFRSTFRDWASENTTYSEEVKEMALAHIIKNKAEAAYRRGDLFEKRRALMDDWQRHCETTTAPGNVLSIKARVAA